MASFKIELNGKSVCRVCMKNHRRMIPIFSKLEDAFIANALSECTAVKISVNDGLPEHICGVCFDDLTYFIAFVGKARKTDHQLRELLKQELGDSDELYQKYSTKNEEFSTTIKCEEADENYIFLEADGEVVYVDETERKEEESQEEENEGERDDESVEYEIIEEKYITEDERDLETCQEERDKDFEYASDADNFDNESSDADFTQPKRKRQTSSIKDRMFRGKRRLVKPSNDDEVDEANKYEDLDEIEQNIFEVVDVDNKFLCCSCLQLFDTQEELKEHGQTEHNMNPISNKSEKRVCEFCYRQYCSVSALKLHQRKFTQTKHVYDCLLCNSRFLACQKRRIHAHNHPEMVSKSSDTDLLPAKVQEKPARICCAQGCNQKFENEEQLLLHSAIDHKANKVQSNLVNAELRPVECPVCYKRFTNKNRLKFHQRRVYAPKRFVCSICGQKFANKNELERHEREHRDEKIFKCELCPKAYYGSDRLKAHMKRHTATREFMCNICGMSYMQKHNLQTHMLMHEGKLPFECEVCNKAFRTKAKLVYHMRVHSGEKPYPCRYCEIAFADSTNRLRHEMSHTGIKPYKCDYCDKTFITKRLKREHESTHTGEKPYRCEECYATFSHSSALSTHNQIVHMD
ncbi:zinc finger protein ZFP2-like [Malaya genurostris]|uniref:zinc finger protein ZFP2-like n=1 Tax=Malaya genurostris TaxID=325434 RepID=UPI0026F38645|nr:zinc finger protein ZFP2-like [Malaya genurostris]